MSPVDIRTARPDDWELFSGLRLDALKDAPLAFGSTYESEAHRTEDEWRDWLGRADGARLIAYVDDEPAGIAAVYLRQEERDDPGPVPELVSMWVHPGHRKSGVGRALVDEVVAWVAQHGFDEVRLMVAAENDAAERFYERIGFSRTDYSQPLPHDETRTEHEMTRPVP
jgi:ribosomal protein S18 acetylase RimI-like enzyme